MRSCRVVLGVRWIGWTLLFGLIFTGVLAPFAWEAPSWGSSLRVGPLSAGELLVVGLFFGSLLLTLIAPGQIGEHFPSPWWPAGPPVAVASAVFLILTSPNSGSEIPDVFTKLERFALVVRSWAWIPLVILAILYSALAIEGVKTGRARRRDGPWQRCQGRSTKTRATSRPAGFAPPHRAFQPTTSLTERVEAARLGTRIDSDISFPNLPGRERPDSIIAIGVGAIMLFVLLVWLFEQLGW